MTDIGVYCITNKVNNKKYIGSSKSIRKRKYGHFTLLKKNKHKNKHLQNAYNLYGKENFIFTKLQTGVNIEDLYQYERNFIIAFDTLKNGYNQCLPNPNGSPGFSEETIDKLRRLGYVQHYGEIVEEEYQEWLKNKDPMDLTNHPNCKPIISINKNGKEIEYKSIAYASRVLKVHEENIRRSVDKFTGTGKPKKCKGFIWKRKTPYF